MNIAPSFPSPNSTNAADWGRALSGFFGVGKGMPTDWWMALGLDELKKRTVVLREMVVAKTNEDIVKLLNLMGPALALKRNARIAHTGNYLFVLQDAKKVEDVELAVLSWTQPRSSPSYIYGKRVKRSNFVPKDITTADVCRICLMPIEETFGMSVRVTCLDGSDRPTFVAILAVGRGIDPVLDIFVFSGCERGIVAGSYLIHAPNTRQKIADTLGFPYTHTIFFIHRSLADKKTQLYVNVNSDYDDWAGRTFKGVSNLMDGGHLLGIDNSTQTAAVFQLNYVNGEFGIEEVPMTDKNTSKTRFICTVPFEFAKDFNSRKKDARFILLDSSFDHRDQTLYVAYEDRSSANTVNVRKVPRTSSQCKTPDFMNLPLVYYKAKPLKNHYSYSFRAGDTFVVAKQNIGFETILLKSRTLPTSQPGQKQAEVVSLIEEYPTMRPDLDNVHLVPRAYDASFKRLSNTNIRNENDDD